VIQPDQVVLEVPPKVMLTPDSCGEEEPLAAALKKSGASHTAVLLACFLDQQASRSSFWSPYFAALPRSLAHLPLLTPVSQVDQLLQGSPTLVDIHHKRNEIDKIYDYLDTSVGIVDTISRDSFMKAWGAVESHAHSQGDGEPVMIPLVDMVNHNEPPSLKLKKQGNNTVAVATRQIRQGEEVAMSYAGGTQAVQQIFRQFGFVDRTLRVRLKIPLRLTPDDIHYEQKKVLFPAYLVRTKAMFDDAEKYTEEKSTEDLFRIRTFPSHRILWCSPEGLVNATSLKIMKPSMEEALKFLRFVTITGMDDVEQLCDSSTPPECKAKDEEHEKRALERLAVELEFQMKAFPTTISQDDALLAKGDPWAPYVEIRRMEKRCMHHFIQLARGEEFELPGPDPEADIGVWLGLGVLLTVVGIIFVGRQFLARSKSRTEKAL